MDADNQEQAPTTTWMPNRKVLAGAVTGAFAAIIMAVWDLDLPNEADTAFGVFIVAVVSYFVPLPKE